MEYYSVPKGTTVRDGLIKLKLEQPDAIFKNGRRIGASDVLDLEIDYIEVKYGRIVYWYCHDNDNPPWDP